MLSIRNGWVLVILLNIVSSSPSCETLKSGTDVLIAGMQTLGCHNENDFVNLVREFEGLCLDYKQKIEHNRATAERLNCETLSKKMYLHT
jgi:hypothetical protein